MPQTPPANGSSLSNKHRAIMRDRVLDGRTNRDLAIKYEISESHLSIITNSPLWKKEEALLHDQVIKEHQTKLLTLVPIAIEALGEIVQRRTTFDVVDPATNEGQHLRLSRLVELVRRKREGIRV